MTIDFSMYLGPWGLANAEPDCIDCGNLGYIETQAASFVIPIPCPECARSDWAADDVAAGWAEQ